MHQSSFPAIDPSAPLFAEIIQAVLAGIALGSDTSVAKSKDEASLTSEALQTLYTLDGICEVLEWNNEGVSADETACIWLAQLRWLRTVHGTLPDSAPFAPDRPLDQLAPTLPSVQLNPTTLAALSEPQMQLVDNNNYTQAVDDGALLRAVVLGFLPVPEPSTVISLTARSTALTHGADAALITAIATALLIRACLSLHLEGTAETAEHRIVQAVHYVADTLDPETPSTQKIAIFSASARRQSLAQFTQMLRTTQDFATSPNDVMGHFIATIRQAVSWEEESSTQQLGTADLMLKQTSSQAALLVAIIAAAYGSTAFHSAVLDPYSSHPALKLVWKNWCSQLGITSSPRSH